MGYDIEKEKREAIEAGRRALNSLQAAKENLNSAKELGSGRYVWRWLFHHVVKTFQNGSGETKYGTGKVRSS